MSDVSILTAHAEQAVSNYNIENIILWNKKFDNTREEEEEVAKNRIE